MSSYIEDKLPLYHVRQYHSIEEEYGLKIISTAKNKYVLDNKKLPGGYWDRRLKLLTQEALLPYKLYPMNKRCDTLEQVISLRHKIFIDGDGNLFKYVPTKWYKFNTASIREVFSGDNGDSIIWCSRLSKPFRVTAGVLDLHKHTHVVYFDTPRGLLLYSLAPTAKLSGKGKYL